jgi:hypothetical protein
MPRRSLPHPLAHARALALCLFLALALCLSPAAAQDRVPSVVLERQIVRAYDRGDYTAALRLVEKFLEDTPRHPEMLYNAACLCCYLERVEDAADFLFRSVKSGFLDFELIRTDPDLEPLHGHGTYEAILEAAEKVRKRAADSALEMWRSTYGVDNYRYEKDEGRRIAYATAIDAVSHLEMRRMLERQADEMIRTFFEQPPVYYVLVAVPTPKHARQIFGPDDAIGGVYQHARHRVVARDTGASLRHEFFHALHYSHMERIGQQHPLWMQEGLASLYEAYELDIDGKIRFLPNERHNIVKRRARIGRLMKWEELFHLSADNFMARAGHLYPQARSIFEYVADEGLLAEWYRTYVEGFDEERSGTAAFEKVFAQPLHEIERAWRQWLSTRPLVDVSIEYGDAALGIQTAPRASNDGVLVAEVLRQSGARRAGIRPGDIIVAIDGRPTRSMLELMGIIGGKKVGETVRVRLRRDGAYQTITVVLRPLTPYSTPGR